MLKKVSFDLIHNINSQYNYLNKKCEENQLVWVRICFEENIFKNFTQN